MSVEQAKRTSTYRTMTSDGHIYPFPLWLRTWFLWWLLPCWRTSTSISSVISAIRSSHWKRQVGWKPLSYISSAYQQNGCALEGRTFWTYIQIKTTTLRSSLNKHHFLWFFILPHWFGRGILYLEKTQETPKHLISTYRTPKDISTYKIFSQEKILRN